MKGTDLIGVGTSFFSAIIYFYSLKNVENIRFKDPILW